MNQEEEKCNLFGMNVGARFRKLRIARGQKEAKRFALENGFTWSDVRAFENNQTDPSISRILKFIRPLRVTLAEFFSEEDKLAKEYLGSKSELIMVTEDQQIWVDRLLKLLESGNRARILTLQMLLQEDDGMPARVPIKKVGSIPKLIGARRPKKEKRSA